MTNMWPIFFMFISDKYMSRVFMDKWKICLWVSNRHRWSAVAAVLSPTWCDWLCFHWFRSMSSLSSTGLALMQLWVSFLWWIMSSQEFLDLVFAMFSSFLFIAVCFHFVLWRWRWVMVLFQLCDWKSWTWFNEIKIWVL